MEAEKMHVRIVPMTADHLDEVADNFCNIQKFRSLNLYLL